MKDSSRSWRAFSGSCLMLCAAAVAAFSASPVFGQFSSAVPARQAASAAPARERQSAISQRVLPSVGGAGVIRPSVFFTYDAFPFSPLFGYPAVNLGFPQPLGHQIISYGASGYIYRPVTDLGSYYDRALAALRTADYPQVLIELEPVLAELPDDGDTWMVRAQALFALGAYGKAAESLHMALRLLPQQQWGNPVLKVREYFASEGEFAARLGELESHVRRNPREGAGHFLLGYFYGYRGKVPEAEHELRMALRLMTGDNGLANALLAPLQAAETDGGDPGNEKPRPGLRENDGPREF
jgi:tetratricopeptide (TPR) repeat protein